MNLLDQFILQHVQISVLRTELVRVSREPGMQEAKVELKEGLKITYNDFVNSLDR